MKFLPLFFLVFSITLQAQEELDRAMEYHRLQQRVDQGIDIHAEKDMAEFKRAQIERLNSGSYGSSNTSYAENSYTPPKDQVKELTTELIDKLGANYTDFFVTYRPEYLSLSNPELFYKKDKPLQDLLDAPEIKMVLSKKEYSLQREGLKVHQQDFEKFILRANLCSKEKLRSMDSIAKMCSLKNQESLRISLYPFKKAYPMIIVEKFNNKNIKQGMVTAYVANFHDLDKKDFILYPIASYDFTDGKQMGECITTEFNLDKTVPQKLGLHFYKKKGWCNDYVLKGFSISEITRIDFHLKSSSSQKKPSFQFDEAYAISNQLIGYNNKKHLVMKSVSSVFREKKGFFNTINTFFNDEPEYESSKSVLKEYYVDMNRSWSLLNIKMPYIKKAFSDNFPQSGIKTSKGQFNYHASEPTFVSLKDNKEEKLKLNLKTEAANYIDFANVFYKSKKFQLGYCNMSLIKDQLEINHSTFGKIDDDFYDIGNPDITLAHIYLYKLNLTNFCNTDKNTPKPKPTPVVIAAPKKVTSSREVIVIKNGKIISGQAEVDRVMKKYGETIGKAILRIN